MIFNHHFSRLGTAVEREVSGEELRQLPQFYRASVDLVWRLGGPLYREILAAIPIGRNARRHISIDSRVHMLMPGFLPCIPGWHCDDFHRSPNGSGIEQPDLAAIHQRYDRLGCQHWAVVIGDTAMTEFVSQILEIEDSLVQEWRESTLYRHLNEYIDARPELPKTKVKSGDLVRFDSFDIHRGTPADKPGWRLFFRLTESDHRVPRDEIRMQTQVYLPAEGVGW